MSHIVLVTDSSCDLSMEYLKEKNIRMLPLTVEIMGEVYKDIIDLEPNKFYEKIENPKAIPRTAGVNEFAFEECFKEELEKGKEILYIGLSSKLSSTYDCAAMAKKNLESDDIYLFDSLSAAFGQGLLVREAVKLIEEGKRIDEIVDLLESIRPRMDYSVMINNVEMLKRSGRINGIQAFASNILSIKPVISVDDGKVNVMKKIRGTKSAIKFLVSRLEEIGIDNKYPVIICYGTDMELRGEIEEKLKSVIGTHPIESMQIGATIGSHTGSSGIGLFFIKEQ